MVLPGDPHSHHEDGERPGPALLLPYYCELLPAWERITADAVISAAGVLFYGLILRADGVGAAQVTVFDGLNANGRRYTAYDAPVSDSRDYAQGPPVPLQYGLFVDVGANVAECLVRYLPAQDARPGLYIVHGEPVWLTCPERPEAP